MLPTPQTEREVMIHKSAPAQGEQPKLSTPGLQALDPRTPSARDVPIEPVSEGAPLHLRLVRALLPARYPAR